MIDWKNTIISDSANVAEAINTIDKNIFQIALVVSSNNKLIGIVTDRDIRRGLLNKITLQDPVISIVNKNPSVIIENSTEETIQKTFRKTKYRHLPVVDKNNTLIGLKVSSEISITNKNDNFVVLMAGGMGERLKPLTNNIPKPMLQVGDKPILQTIIENFIDQGFYNFYISVNYKSEIIEEFFKDGSKWGVNIKYLREDKKLGTAGALSLLPEKTDIPIIVMNGDLLTKMNFNNLIDFHFHHHASATMCVREYDFQVPYGVVNLNDKMEIQNIDEKPIHSFFVNAGIYVIDPQNLELIEKNKRLDMPFLFEKIKDLNRSVLAFPIREYWLDIGRLEDYKRANGDFIEEFS
ncbi:MAG: nucleotidyltransferase family protein [Leptospiraceae bacterium]|nr:nucleotidyltransferase family protein [Leptospiraceae bacterium]